MNEQKQYRCNNSTVIIREGNIVGSECEVVVSSDNVWLQMATGVSRTIHESAGEHVDVDLDKIEKIELGDVVVTTAGNLRQRYIFHCAADKRRSKRNNEIIPIIINRSVVKCLQLLPMLGVYSIAFPAIGTGAVGIKTECVAEAMLDVIAEHLKLTNHNLTVEIFAWGPENYDKWLAQVEQNKDYELIEEKASGEEAQIPQNDSEIFISYSWYNEAFALELEKWLDELGIPHFIDRRVINGGQDHKEVIIKNLKKVKLVLFLSSKESNASPAVKGEICNAIFMRIPIIPLRLDMTPYRDSFMYDLVNSLWVDLTGGLDCKKEELLKYIQSYGIKTT